MCVIGWSLILLKMTICWSSLLANWMPVNSNSNWDLFKVSCLIIIMQPGYKGLPTMKKQILSVYWLTKVHNVSNINIFKFKAICSEWIYLQRFIYFPVFLPPSNWHNLCLLIILGWFWLQSMSQTAFIHGSWGTNALSALQVCPYASLSTVKNPVLSSSFTWALMSTKNNLLKKIF